jgi:opacity protein-like surface antigen
MKKVILSVLAVFAFGFANAQSKGGSDSMAFGAKAGLDMISSKADGASADSATGFFVGGFAEFGLMDKLVLQPGLNYHTASKDGIKFSYLSIPVLAKYEIAESFNLMAGPSMYYSLESTDDDKTRFNLDLGASYNITDEFFVEPRYSLGLSGDTKVSHFLIGVGYKF